MFEAGERWSGGGRDLDRIVNLSDGVFAIAITLLGEYGNHQLPVAIYAGTLAIGRLLLTVMYWYTTGREHLADEDPARVRFFLIRGLTIPVIFLPSIGISFFSVNAAIWSWALLIAVDAVVFRRRLR